MFLLLALQEFGGEGGGGGAGVGFVFLIQLVLLVLFIASAWKVFVKAGQPGWAAIIPIYNVIVLLQIVGRPLWWILLMLIPVVNVIIGILVTLDVAKSYGRSAGFAIGLLLLPFVFWPILGFGDASYRGPAAA